MSNENRATLQMLTCAILWSLAGIFIKLIPWNAVALTGIRSLFAGITVFVFIKIKGYKIEVNKKTVASGFIMAIVFITFVVANKLTTSANAIVLQFTSPMFIVVASVVLFKQKIKKSDLIAVIVTMLGISLFFFDKLSGGYLLGNIIAIISGALMAAMYMSMGNIEGQERFSAILFGHLFAFLIGIPFVIATKPEMSLMPVIYIIILGVIQLGIPYILYAKALNYCPPLACNLLAAVEPLLNPVWVFIFDGEKPGVFAIIGGVVVVASVTVWCVYNNRTEEKNA